MSEPVREQIPAALDGERVDRVVSLVAGCSGARRQRSIDRGAVRIDGRGGPAGRQRGGGRQLLSVDLRRAPRRVLPAPDPSVPVDVVYEDADVLVVDKPPGSSCTPAPGREGARWSTGCWLATPAGRRRRSASAGSCTGSTGTRPACSVALTPTAYTALVDALGIAVERRYTALVWGVPEVPRGVIDAPIGRSPRQPTRQAVVAGGRPACTLRGARPVRPAHATWPSWVASWRPAGPTRSACTWRRSAIPSSATATTAASRRPSPAADVPARRAPA